MTHEHILELEKEIDRLLCEKDFVIIGIDGPCTAGKTTLANQLSSMYDCNLFHMDDFFLRPEQRTPDRYDMPGGNVDYERFHEEVLLPLTLHKPFAYQPFDCHTQSLKECISVTPKALAIIEGTYSMHPSLTFAYDLSVYLHVDETQQRERILQRNPALHDKFFHFWIPLEKQYFSWLSSNYNFDLIF